MGFAVPITDGVVDTRYGVNSMGFDVIGFSVPVAGGMQPPNVGQQTYTTAGTHSWTCPDGVTSVCVVVVNGGGGGGMVVMLWWWFWRSCI